MERRLARARGAKALLPLSDVRDAAALALKGEEKRKRAADTARAERETAAETASKRLAGLRARASDVEGDRRSLIDLERHRTALAASEALRLEWEQAQAALRRATEALRTIDTKRTSLAAHIEALEKARTVEAERKSLKARRKRPPPGNRSPDRFERAKARLEEAKREIAAAEGAEKAARIDFEMAERTVAEAEAARLASHAVQLAESLKDASPARMRLARAPVARGRGRNRR